jgi:hypothetical protein
MISKAADEARGGLDYQVGAKAVMQAKLGLKLINFLA